MVRPPARCTRCRLVPATNLLLNYETEQRIDLCTACLATVGRMKAPLDDEARQIVLLGRAKQDGCEVWQTESALYLLPAKHRPVAVVRPRPPSP